MRMKELCRLEGWGNDFLAVIDADPASPSNGHLVTTVATDQQTMYAHHTEYTVPASGMLFANDHDAGRTFIFDVRDPLHPTVETSFTDMAGYMHPHSFVRLPNGHVLATFQHTHHGAPEGHMGTSGGLVEIDDEGKVVRASSNADPSFPDALLSPYGLVVLPESDRVVSTNSSMHQDDIFRGVTYQLWRLSDLKLLKTDYFDVGENRYSHISPEEPRLGPDGSIFVQTLGSLGYSQQYYSRELVLYYQPQFADLGCGSQYAQSRLPERKSRDYILKRGFPVLCHQRLRHHSLGM